MIVITHTRDDGTLIEGSARGDGIYQTLHALHPHWRYMRSIGQIGLLMTRDKPAKRWMIDAATAALRDAGHDVTVDIDDTPTRTVAQIEAERAERATDRAERMAERAERAYAAAGAKRAEADRITHGYQGEPIKIGHHSENRHRRDLQRAADNTRASMELRSTARYYENRAAAASAYQARREDVGTTRRRIERLEAEERSIAREIAEAEKVDASPVYRERLASRQADVCEKLAYERAELVKRAEASGVRLWSRADFTWGDYVCVGGRWFEVLRVNAKTLTVSSGMNDGRVITGAGSRYSWTDKAPYDRVQGRMSADEMAARLA